MSTFKTVQQMYDWIDNHENALETILQNRARKRQMCYIFGIPIEHEEDYVENLNTLSPLFSLPPETTINLVISDGDYEEGGSATITELIEEMHKFESCMHYPFDFYIEGAYSL